MKLGEKQELFSLLHAYLVLFAYTNGYKIRTGEVLRTKEQAERNARKGTGISNSLHLLKLAVDLNVFKDGEYLKKSVDLQELGDFWKKLHPLCRWGGDFKKKKDGGHFSVTHGGRA